MALKWDITGDNYQFLKTLQESEDGVRHTSQVIEREGGSIETTFKRIQQAAALSVAGFSAHAFIRQAASIRGEFQKLEVAFSTMLESEEKANALMQQLTKTAAITPFDLKGVADGAKQLMAYGVAADEVNDVLIHLGDIAAGLSLPLGDLVYLYGTTMTQGRMFTQDLRQFMGRGIPLADELAKQFGVAKEKVGELVTAGKVGADEFKKAIMSLSSEGGKFGGLMEKQSKTIQGQISNIEDAIDVMFNDIGKQSEGAINASLDLVSTLVEHWEAVGTAILAAAEAYGIYKATLMTMTAFNSAATNIGYDAEIASLSKLLPMKEAEANADLQIAVAEGRLSASKAETIASMRMELNERLKVLAVKEAAAKADYKAALEQHLIAQRNMAVAQSQVKIALETGTAEEIAAAKRGAATAKQELQTAAIAKNTAHKELNTVSTQKNALANGLDAAATAGNTAATGILTQAKLALKRAIDAVNASFLASPIFWIAAAIAATTFVVYKLATAESAQEKATRKANEALEEQNKLNEERNQKVMELLRTIQDKNATELAQLKAYNELKTLVPDITDKYSQQALAAMDAADSQKELNSQLEQQEYEEAKNKAEQYRKEVERLRKVVGDGTPSLTAMYQSQYTGRNEQVTAKRQLPFAEENLRVWEQKVREIERLQAEIAEKQRPIEIRLSEARENEAVRKRIFDFYDKAMVLTNDWQSANETINFSTGQTRLDEFIENAQKEIDDLREQQRKNPIDEYLRIELNEKQKILNDLLAMKANWTTMGVLNLPFTFTVNYASAQAAMEAAKQKAAGLAAQQANTPTLADAYNKAQKAYKDAKEKVDKMSKNRSAYTQADWDKAQEELKDAKTTYSGLGGDTSEKGSKNAAKTRQQRLREQQRYNDMERRLELDKQRTSVDLQFSTDQAVIDAMEDGSKKTLAQIQLDYRKQKEEIQRGYEDLKQQKIDNARQLFEANPDNKDKVFDPSTVNTDYTDEETANYEAQMKAATETFNRNMRERQKEELMAMYDYLKEYGSFEQQKLAITKEYEQKIREARTEGEKRKLQKEKNQALSRYTYESISMGIDWSALLKGVGNLSSEMIKPMLDQLEAYTKTDEYSKAEINEREKVIELIDELRNYVGSDNETTWEDLATAISNFSDAVANYKEAEKNEKAAIATREEARERFNKGEITQSDLKRAEDTAMELGDRTAAAKEAMIGLGKTLNETSDKVKEYTSPLTATLNKMGSWQGVSGFDSLKQSVAGFDQLKGSLDSILPSMGEGMAKTIGSGLSDVLGSGLSSIGGGLQSIMSSGIGGMVGIVAQIPQLILNLVSTVKDMVTGILDSLTELISLRWIDSLVNSILESVGNLIDAIFDLPENLYKVIESIAVNGVGGLLNSVIGRVGNILSFGALSSKGPADWFTNSNAEEVAETSKALTEENERLRKSIDRLDDTMNKKSGVAAIKDYELLVAQQQKVNANLVAEINNQMGYHNAHHSNNYYASDDIGKWWNTRLNQLFAEHRDDYGKNSVGSVNLTEWHSIYSLSPEQLAIIRDYASDIWEYLTTVGKYDQSEYWENAADAAGKVQEITHSLYENLTQMSFDTLKDNFLSSLMDMSTDWDETLEGMMDNFEEMFRKASLNFALSNVNKELQRFWEDWGERMKNGTELTEDDIKFYKRRYQQLVEEGLRERERIAMVTGYEGNEEPYEQEATKGAWQGMSEDTGQELNGRFTALQVAGENISNQMTLAVTQINLITGFTQSSNHYLMDIRNSIIMGNTYLEDIAKYSKAIYSEFASKLDTIANNTKY